MAVISSNIHEIVKIKGTVEFEDYSGDKLHFELMPSGKANVTVARPGSVLLEKEDVDFLRNMLRGEP